MQERRLHRYEHKMRKEGQVERRKMKMEVEGNGKHRWRNKLKDDMQRKWSERRTDEGQNRMEKTSEEKIPRTKM